MSSADYDGATLAVIGVLALGPAIPREVAARFRGVSEGDVSTVLAQLVADGRVVRLPGTDRYALIVR